MTRSGSRPSAERANYVTEVGTEPPMGVQEQSPWSTGQRDFVPLKLTIFSYFRD